MMEPRGAGRPAIKGDQIRAAAQRLFLQHGYAGASMDAIAAEAGVAKQTLYRYYPSKESLFTDVLRQLLTAHLPAALTVDVTHVPLTSRADLEAALRAFAQASVASALQPEALALLRMIVAETPGVPHLAALVRAAITERGGVTVRGLLERAQRQGLVAISDADAAARLFVGGVLTYVLSDGLFAPADVPQPPAPTRLAALVQLFMRAVSPPGARASQGGERR
jgi:AcrR family transcriptional regulator